MEESTPENPKQIPKKRLKLHNYNIKISQKIAIN